MSQLVFSICWNYELGSNALEGMDLLAKEQADREKSKVPSSMTFVQAACRRGGPD